MLELARALGQTGRVTGTDKNSSREERLAAKLRENLRRRKAQARALGEPRGDALPNEPDGG